MPPSSQQQDRHETPLQAILLTDPAPYSDAECEGTENAFSAVRSGLVPATLDAPPALMPVNNVLAIDYVLEWLAGAGVKEVFVCSRDHGSQIASHLSSSPWSASMSLRPIFDRTLRSPGDVLRDLDRRAVVRSDPFLLLSADVIASADLSATLASHAHRKKTTDHAAVMTAVLRSVGRRAEVRNRAALAVGLDARSGRVLTWTPELRATHDVPCSFLRSASETVVRTDLADTGIYICSPDVLARFSENFDYSSVDVDFIGNGVAEEEEGLQNRVYAHVLDKKEYASRFTCWRTYGRVCQDLMRRWAYPLTPEQTPSGYEGYIRGRGGVYRIRGSEAKVDRGASVSSSIVGRCKVGKGCAVQGSVLGHDVLLGTDVALTNSHVWEGSTIGDGAVVTSSVICHGVTIKSGAVVPAGCVIGKGCVIDAGVKLKQNSRITCSVYGGNDDDDDDDFFSSDDESEDGDASEDHDDKTDDEENKRTPVTSDPDVVGPEGIGRLFVPPASEESDDDDATEDQLPALYTLEAGSLGFNHIAHLSRADAALWKKEMEDDDEFSRADSGDDGATDDGTNSSVPSPMDVGDDFEPFVIGRPQGVDVVKELKSICLDHEEGSSTENLAIELNSFKFSQNASYADVVGGVVQAIFTRMQLEVGTSPGALVSRLRKQLDDWSPILQKFSQDLNDEVAIVKTVEGAALGDIDEATMTVLSKQPAFRFVLQTLHDAELVQEEALLVWAGERRMERGTNDDSARMTLFEQQPTQDFLEWLEESSEEEETDEEEDEDDSDEE